MNQELSMRIIGFILSLILTLVAYLMIQNPELFGFDNSTAALVIFILALTQSLVQLIFFINVWHEKGPLWNLSVFISTVSIIFIVIFFSIWIMNHLNTNMML